MSKVWVLFFTALFISGGVNDVIHGNISSAVFEFIFGVGLGINLLSRLGKE